MALGIYLAEKTEENAFEVQQPGGTIQVKVGRKILISTEVRITCEGVVYLSDHE
ncbi:hypothetical protein [Lentibacillus sp. JNUCC-1]|uniref:hypothetical protein n=1 Tax=Lentibacillus sp. JNUCC-1 TaxID=2654513 RepID=UPI001E3C91DD|nr:hypothetical protein [Lentibacillus sp. JNUCC-1]